VNGLAQIRNVSFAAANEAEAGSNCIHDTGRWPDVCTVLATPAWNNLGHVPSNDTDNCRWGDLNFVDLTNMNDPQPVPAPGSELIGSADQTWAMLSANSDFFDLTPNYRGAFAPGVPMEEQWTAGWTNFDPQNQYYLTPVRESGDDLPSVGTYSSVYPNPFNPSTVIKFSVPTSGQVTLKVYDMRGQEVATLVDEIMEVGSFERPFFAVDLPSGTYFYRLSGNGFSDTGKMQLVK